MLLKKVPRKNGEIVNFGGYEMRVSELKLKYERYDGIKILAATFKATCTDNKCNNDIRDTYYNGNDCKFYEFAREP